MKKVVLLGDSIRLIGYGKRVEELLDGEYMIWQPEDNCRYAKYTLRMLFDFQEEIKNADIVHWNNGLWDLCDLFGDGAFTSLEEYKANMLRIASIIQAWGCKLIFSTTTPTHPDYPYHSDERIRFYNEEIVKELQEKGVYINDLYGAMCEHKLDGIAEDQLHLNEKGIEICAKCVADAIRNIE